MSLPSARRALTDSALALLLATVALAMFVPPLLGSTLQTPLRVAATALALAVALPLHWVWLGIGARRMGRSVRGWVALALLFPVGGAAALLLLLGLLEEPAARPVAAG